MTEKKTIDNIFREGLSNYAQDPPDGLWDDISEKQQKKAMPWWQKLPRLLILLGLGVVVCIVAVSFVISVLQQQKLKKSLKTPQANHELLTVQTEENLQESEAVEMTHSPFETLPNLSSEKPGQTPMHSHANKLLKQPNTENASLIIEENTPQYSESTGVEISESDMSQNIDKPNIVHIPEAVATYPDNRFIQMEAPTENPVSPVIENTLPVVYPQSHDSIVTPFIDKGRKPVLSIGVYAFPAYTEGLFNTGDALPENYTNLRNSSEKGIVSLNPGLSFQLAYKRFFVRTGFTYNVLGEQNAYNFDAIAAIDTNGGYYEPYTYTIPDPNNSNNTIVIFDSLWLSVYDTTFQNIQNNHRSTYNYFCLPLEAGFNFNLDERNRLGFSVGLSYMHFYRQNAQILNTTAGGFISGSTVEPLMKKSLLAYSLSVIYTRHFNNSMSFYVEPRFLQTNGTVFEKPFGVTQSYRQLGVRTGINIKIK